MIKYIETRRRATDSAWARAVSRECFDVYVMNQKQECISL